MRALTVALSALAFCGAAHASDDDLNIAGAWSFQAEVQEGCTFSGIAHLRRGASPGLYACEMTAQDVCAGTTAVVRQTCIVTREGKNVKVKAFIEEYFTEPSGNYAPDDFNLVIDTEAGEMRGHLDSYGIWTAVWKRTTGATS